MIKHTIAPIYDKNSRILILGSFPSVKSREQQFFYGHKQNRFWKVLAGILGYEVPQTILRRQISGQFIQMVEKLLNCMINTFTR